MVQWLRLCTYTAWECEFNPWSGTYDLTCHSVAKKILKKKRKNKSYCWKYSSRIADPQPPKMMSFGKSYLMSGREKKGAS